MSSIDCDQEFVEYIKGADFTQVLQLRKNGDPFDITGVTEIEIKIKKEDDTIFSAKLTTSHIVVMSSVAGKISLSWSDTEGALLKAISRGTFDAIVDIGSTRKIFRFKNALTISSQAVS